MTKALGQLAVLASADCIPGYGDLLSSADSNDTGLIPFTSSLLSSSRQQMEEDDRADSGDVSNAPAQSSTSAGIASWHPALRPDSAHRQGHSKKASVNSVDDFFDRYPAPTPEKPRPQHATVNGESAEGATGQRIFAGEEKMDRVEEDENEAPLFGHGETAGEQAEELEERLPNSSASARLVEDKASIEAPSNAAPLSPIRKIDAIPSGLGLDYEHQGETTELERAIEEAPNAPLMMDPGEPPVVENINTNPPINAEDLTPSVGFDGTVQASNARTSAPAAPPHLDRSFTTNFTEIPQSQQPEADDMQASSDPISKGWPAVADDKTFGELLGDDVGKDAQLSKPLTQPEESLSDGWGDSGGDDLFQSLVGKSAETATKVQAVDVPKTSGLTEDAKQDPTSAGGDDLTAAWQAALGDDDLLDSAGDLDPSKFFGDDDDGFLEDEMPPLPSLPTLGKQPPTSNDSYNRYQPSGSKYDDHVPSPVQHRQPPFLKHGHSRSVSTPHTGLDNLYGEAPVPQQPQRPGLPSAQSFVDKSKAGYQSPYDLPMDVLTQPRQRPRPAPATTTSSGPSPPPRSSSFSSQHGPPSSRPSVLTSASSGGPVVPGQTPSSAVQTPISATRTPSSDSGFFADLPMTSKARSRPSAAYTPQSTGLGHQGQNAFPFPGQGPPQPTARGTGPPSGPPPQRSAAPPAPAPAPAPVTSPMYGDLRQPERLPLLPDQPPAVQQIPAPPTGLAQTHRYSPSKSGGSSQGQPRFSPAPAAQQPPPASRYSPSSTSLPAQPKRQPSITAITATAQHPFAPRTSSPLAYPNEKQQSPYTPDGQRSNPSISSSPPKTNGVRPSIMNATSDRVSPQRLNTHSPPATSRAAKSASLALEQSMSATAGQTSQKAMLTHRRQLSRELNFSPPMDERAQDLLERWKGYPIFKWSNSGAVVSTFPQQTPFYAAGHAIPSVRCTPGPIAVQDAKITFPLEDRIAKFPGPLAARAKGKKKEVLAWMSGKIEDLEKHVEAVRLDFDMDADLKKRTEEKLLLWKIVRIFVEHNGTLEGDAKIDEEVRSVLLPNVAQVDTTSPTTASSSVQSEQLDRTVILELRQALLEGQRERAVWLAEDKKLWGHAMLLASTMGPDVWKRTVQSFVRSQVKPVGSDARSLAALYQVFGGNAEECADELVPPSARHGRQFVSMTGAVSGDPLAGLDQWRETLGLVAGNRTPNDTHSLIALGKLLNDYGRAEAAHTCFLFARQGIKHTGADDAEADLVLLGANHRTTGEPFGSNLDNIILTEIYEWASSLSAPSVAVHYLPHLQSFKLVHAYQLAAHGLKNQAQAYCDHITSAYTSTTRPSPYYHPTFTQSVNDLSAFLSQTPHSGPQSLLSKTAMNKVSSGAASWFTKFVSGEDDTQSNSSGFAPGSDDMNGPFGRVGGDSPTLSRTGSVAELYNPMMGGSPPILSNPALSTPPQHHQASFTSNRHALASGANRYTPGATSNPAHDSRRPVNGSIRSYAPTPVNALGAPRPENGRASSDFAVPYAPDSRRGSSTSSTPYGSYEPRPTMLSESTSYGFQPPIAEQPEPLTDEQGSAFDPATNTDIHHEPVPDAEGGIYAPPASSYAPPGVAPVQSSYQVYEPGQPTETGDDSPPRPKKSFMDDDDDDDLAKRAAAIQKDQKSAADRQADDAFRKAAEADAQRDKSKDADKRGSGWFGGWFKKDANAPQQGPIRAKLGEENSFVYDEKLKKWVNKKAGAEAAAPVAATPPPPKGPASRMANPPAGPPSGPPSRVASGTALAGPPGRPPLAVAGSGPPSRAGTPPSAPSSVLAVNGGDAAPPSAPPSRPATSMSNASSLDDLLGGPPGPGRKAGGTVKGKKKGGRYVDVMGQK